MRRLIVFLIPEIKIVNGGVLSIFSLCKESRRFAASNNFDVVISTYPGTETYKKNDLFENDETILSFDEVVSKYKKLDSLILHIPEYAAPEIRETLMKKYGKFLDTVGFLHVNVLNQNIEIMPPPIEIVRFFEFADRVTQTTAHVKTTSQEICDEYGVPLHFFCVRLDPSDYEKPVYSKKQNIIAVSSDDHPMKSKIINAIKEGLPEFDIREIDNLTFDQYKSLIADAKFTITFGEGFDGYLIEPTLSRSVAFAVYNEDFFPSEDYLSLENIYESYDEMLKNIVQDISRIDNAKTYEKIIEPLYKKLEEIYSYKKYINNIERFYNEDYTYLPNDNSREHIFLKELERKESIIQEQKDLLSKSSDKIYELKEKELILNDVLNSHSWKITRPLRKVNKLHRKN